MADITTVIKELKRAGDQLSGAARTVADARTRQEREIIRVTIISARLTISACIDELEGE